MSQCFTNILLANSEDPNQTPCYVMLDMGLHFLPLSPGQKGAMLIWVSVYGGGLYWPHD